MVQSAEYDSVHTLFELAMKVCEEQGEEMKDLLADTAFSYARYGEETNMDPQKVYQYCLQFHQIRQELLDGSDPTLQDLATSHTSLAQGYLLLDKYADAVRHCKQCIELELGISDPLVQGTMSQFAHIYQAWGWWGLKQYGQAAGLATMVIEYRAKTFGADDVESIK